jgi:hypothetical protein
MLSSHEHVYSFSSPYCVDILCLSPSACLASENSLLYSEGRVYKRAPELVPSPQSTALHSTGNTSVKNSVLCCTEAFIIVLVSDRIILIAYLCLPCTVTFPEVLFRQPDQMISPKRSGQQNLFPACLSGYISNTVGCSMAQLRVQSGSV